jgi:hypothetical protein
VVREDEVAAAGLHVELRTEPVERDGGALDVPAGSATAEGRLPGGLARALEAPDERVQRVALAPPVGVSPALGEDGAGLLGREVRQRQERRVRGLLEVEVGVLGVARILDGVDDPLAQVSLDGSSTG